MQVQKRTLSQCNPASTLQVQTQALATKAERTTKSKDVDVSRMNYHHNEGIRIAKARLMLQMAPRTQCAELKYVQVPCTDSMILYPFRRNMAWKLLYSKIREREIQNVNALQPSSLDQRSTIQ